MASRFLSKSKYLAGIQCPKLLWFHYNAKGEIPEADEQTQAIFNQGHEVGELAKRLYPDGLQVTWDQPYAGVIGQTQEFLKARKPLFEAGFRAKDAYARADILKHAPGGKWDIIEVKMGTEVKPVNLDDVAFQRHCYESAGLPIRKCFLMHVNNEYVRDGEVDPKGLFTAVDVTVEAAAAMDDLDDRIRDMMSVIAASKCPDKDIGPHCSDPYDCPLMDKCWKRVNAVEDSVFNLYRLRQEKKWSLYSRGILRNRDLPDDMPLSEAQQIQVAAERTGKPHVDRRVVSAFLSRLRYPLYFLDFETFQTAIPMVDRTKPYQQIPFQFSLHVQYGPGAVPAHHGWLWDGKGDPRLVMLDELRGLIGPDGSVVSYNAGFERSRLNEAAAALPKHARWVRDVTGRIVDLLDPFRSFDVYHPAQRGSASVKSVLPALTGKGYDDLAISDGAQASLEYLRVMYRPTSVEDRDKVRRDLETYCGLDTMGMVDIVAWLLNLVR